MTTNSALLVITLMLILGCGGGNSSSQSVTGDPENGDPDTTVTVQKKILPQEKAFYKSVCSIPVPPGFKRSPADSGSFAQYLRDLPLKQNNNIVYLYNGQKKYNQSVQFAVIKMDVGKRDLQQCADAVMRLRAEYLYKCGKYDDIHFNFVSDNKPRYYNDYCNGDHSYQKFRKYMDYIFSYANTASLSKELKLVENINDMHIGDVFIQTGNPYGHAVIVVDMAKNPDTGKKIFMIAQSYMPAQETHILRNNNDDSLNPWYSTDFEDELHTPEWTFRKENLKRFK